MILSLNAVNLEQGTKVHTALLGGPFGGPYLTRQEMYISTI